MRPTFLRSISVGRIEDLEGDRWAIITSVELFEDMVIVRTVESPIRAPEQSDEISHWMLQDDLGTDYTWKGGGGSGGPDMAHMSATFTPGLPPGVTRLYVHAPHMRADSRPVEVGLS